MHRFYQEKKIFLNQISEEKLCLILMNTMVITTVDIINKKKKVVLVFHDKEDEMWEFLDGEDVSEESAAIISISEMEQIDSSIGELCDLPLGCGAFRDDETQPWKWFEIE